MTNLWLPREEVTGKFPHIFTYSADEVWMAPINPHYEGIVTIFGESDITPSEMEKKVLDAAYNRAVGKNDNLAFRFALPKEGQTVAPYRIIGLELPTDLKSNNDERQAAILREIRNSARDFSNFKIQYFLPMGSRMLPQAALCDSLIIGHLREVPATYCLKDRRVVSDESGSTGGTDCIANSICN